MMSTVPSVTAQPTGVWLSPMVLLSKWSANTTLLALAEKLLATPKSMAAMPKRLIMTMLLS